MYPKFLLLACIFSFMMTGCVGKVEIDDLALVMAVGLDKGENGAIKVTTQIVRPADARGQTGAPAGQTGDPIWSATAEGDTIFEAIRNLATFSSRRVFWAHNYAIVINEDLAREGIADIIDFFSRNQQLRMRTWVLVTPDSASEVVSTLTGLEVIPGEAVDKLFRYTTISAKSPSTQMLDLQSAYLSDTSQPVLARVQLIKRGVSNKKPGQAGAYEQVDLAGAGVFRKDKLVGILKPEEVRGLLPFIEHVESGVVVLSCPGDAEKKMSIEIKNQSFHVEPSIRDGTPAFATSLVVYGSVVEAGCPFTLSDKKDVKKIEKEMEEKLKEEIELVVKKAQEEYKSDFLELGKVFQNRYPSESREIGNWEDVFPSTLVEVNANVTINDSSILYKPTKSGG